MVARDQQAAAGGLVGRVTDDRYQVIRKLSDHQLVWAYEARHVTFGRLVELEVLAPSLASNPAVRACFLRQARRASRLRHRGIVQVEHHGHTTNGSVYLASEPPPGVTLEAVLRRETKLPWMRVRGIALQLTAALSAAHRRSVLHLGLRPAVIHLWMDEAGNERVRISGLGMAEVGAEAQRHPTDDEGTMQLFGDGRYMPPEQMMRALGSVQADVYALGAVLYHMLTGVPPVSGANAFQVMARSGSMQIAPVRSKEPSVPQSVDVSLMRALALEASTRHESVYALELELDKVPAPAMGCDEPEGRAESPCAAPEDEDLPLAHVTPRPHATPSWVSAPAVPAGPPLLVSSRAVHVTTAQAPTMAQHASPGRQAEPWVPVPPWMGAKWADAPPAAMTPTRASEPVPYAATSTPPARILEPPVVGRPLPEPAAPDRTWIVAGIVGLIVAVIGVVVGLLLTDAPTPGRDEPDGRSAKTVGQERRQR